MTWYECSVRYMDKAPLGQNPLGQNPIGQNPSTTKPLALMAKVDKTPHIIIFLNPKMVWFVNKINSSDGSIPGFYNLYLNLVRLSIFDTFTVKLPNAYLAYMQCSTESTKPISSISFDWIDTVTRIVTFYVPLIWQIISSIPNSFNEDRDVHWNRRSPCHNEVHTSRSYSQFATMQLILK